ncbi:aminoglycoside phosphotransferase (APT) family kinase protein [Jatrophihabitans sp. GAS493]|uniref:phosphotransferase family protein n=1 Tax=Jatrophihabitans sp. GAS493 TaxID=1907575 RepID=UPI000BB8C8AB|nr:phosphotransferase family protein [Jatrophihabitans sp. GAS493]SOD72156.1 aminoglycoside phosphotransferase (APT) family kinase protein [Jatrophihabitans sp. GAS493]
MSLDNNLITGIERFLGRPGSVTEVVTVSAGFSNETYLLRGTDVVVRMPPSGTGLLPPYDMHAQHDVLAAVGAALPGLPVPKVFGWSEDPSYIGRPFYLLELLPGASFELEAPAWLTDGTPELRHSVGEQWISAFSNVSKAPPAATLGSPLSATEAYRRWYDLTVADTAKGTASAKYGRILIELLDEIFARGLKASGPATLVHGDSKIANVMWRDGKLSALLDWEMCYNGDPLADLAYMLYWLPADPSLNEMGLPGFDFYSLPGFPPRAEAIDIWQRITGRAADDVQWYEVAEAAKIGSIVLRGVVAHEAGEISDERLSFWPLVIPMIVERAQRLRDTIDRAS